MALILFKEFNSLVHAYNIILQTQHFGDYTIDLKYNLRNSYIRGNSKSSTKF